MQTVLCSTVYSKLLVISVILKANVWMNSTVFEKQLKFMPFTGSLSEEPTKSGSWSLGLPIHMGTKSEIPRKDLEVVEFLHLWKKWLRDAKALINTRYICSYSWQGSWARWALKVPSDSKAAMILCFYVKTGKNEWLCFVSTVWQEKEILQHGANISRVRRSTGLYYEVQAAKV